MSFFRNSLHTLAFAFFPLLDREANLSTNGLAPKPQAIGGVGCTPKQPLSVSALKMLVIHIISLVFIKVMVEEDARRSNPYRSQLYVQWDHGQSR